MIAAALARDVVWRVPGNTIMSGEYRGPREVVEFLRRTGIETDGTYRSRLHTVLANDDWAVAIYRAMGNRNGIDLDVDQALVIRCEDGRLEGDHRSAARLRLRCVLGLKVRRSQAPGLGER